MCTLYWQFCYLDKQTILLILQESLHWQKSLLLWKKEEVWIQYSSYMRSLTLFVSEQTSVFQHPHLTMLLLPLLDFQTHYFRQPNYSWSCVIWWQRICKQRVYGVSFSRSCQRSWRCLQLLSLTTMCDSWKSTWCFLPFLGYSTKNPDDPPFRCWSAWFFSWKSIILLSMKTKQ